MMQPCIYCAIAQWFEVCLCVVDSNPYQLSCPGSSVGRALACRGFESHLGQLFIFPWKKRAVLGVVDLFVVPLPFYLVFTCMPV